MSRLISVFILTLKWLCVLFFSIELAGLQTEKEREQERLISSWSIAYAEAHMKAGQSILHLTFEKQQGSSNTSQT